MRFSVLVALVALLATAVAVNVESDYAMDTVDGDLDPVASAIEEISVASGKESVDSTLETVAEEAKQASVGHVTEGESVAINALLDAIESRLVGAYTQEWSKTVGEAGKDVRELEDKKTEIEARIKSANEGIANSNSEIGASRDRINKAFSEQSNLKKKMLKQLDMINSIRSYLVRIDAPQAFAWSSYTGHNQAYQSWQRFPANQVMYSDVEGHMILAGDGVSTIRYPGMWELYHYSRHYSNNCDINYMSMHYIETRVNDATSASRGIWYRGCNWRHNSIRGFLKTTMNQHISVWLYGNTNGGNDRRNLYLWHASFQSTGSFVRFISENEKDKNEESGKRLVSFHCNTKQSNTQAWYKYCNNRWFHKSEGDENVVTVASNGSMTAQRNGVYRISVQLLQHSQWNVWKKRSVGLKFCPKGANCRWIAASVVGEAQHYTNKIDFPWLAAKGDTFEVWARVFHNSDAYPWIDGNRGESWVAVEYLGVPGGKYHQPVHVSGCALETDPKKEFVPIGNYMHWGNYDQVKAWKKPFNFTMEQGARWLPVCNNMTMLDTTAKTVVARGEGHYCVEASGYYRIQYQLGFREGPDPYGKNSWANLHMWFVVKPSYTLRSTTSDPWGYNAIYHQDFTKGASQMFMEAVFPLQRGQCFLMTRYSHVNTANCDNSNSKACGQKGANENNNWASMQVPAVDPMKANLDPENPVSYTVVTRIARGGSGLWK